MIIDHERRTIDFSDNTTCPLDAGVLQCLREALNINELYCNIIFDGNTLTDDAIGILAAILKGNNPIEYLGLRSCNLRDLDIIHLTHAICTRKSLVRLDLSKNSGITSASTVEIARIIQTVPTIKSIQLIGTRLHENNCSLLISALEGSTSMQVLELPFSVGFRVLNKVRRLLKRNKEPSDSGDRLSDDIGRTHMSLASSDFSCARKVPPRAASLKPQPLPVLAAPTGGSKPAYNAYMANLPEMHQWVDPALMNAAMYIKVLDKRCKMLDEHLSEKRKRILARRGQGC